MRHPDRPQPLKFSEIAGPESGSQLCTLADLQGRQAITRTFGEGRDQREVFIMVHAGKVVAYLNDCPHRHLPLNFHPDRFLEPEGQFILCTNHIALFRIDDGYCTEGPCPGQWLTPMAIRVEGEQVLAG